MAVRRPRPIPDEPTTADVDRFSYRDVLAAYAAAVARTEGPDPDLSKFRQRQDEAAPLIARLEALAATDARIVRLIADAADPDHPDPIEHRMARAALRRSRTFTDAGFAPRGPFGVIPMTTRPTAKETRP